MKKKERKFQKRGDTITLASALALGKLPSVHSKIAVRDTSHLNGILFHDTMGTVTEGPYGDILTGDANTKWMKQNHTLASYSAGAYSGIIEIIHANMCDAAPDTCVAQLIMTTADKVIFTMGIDFSGTTVVYSGSFMVTRVTTWMCLNGAPTAVNFHLYRDDDDNTPIFLNKVTDTPLGPPLFPSVSDPYYIEIPSTNDEVRLHGGDPLPLYTNFPGAGFTLSCCMIG